MGYEWKSSDWNWRKAGDNGLIKGFIQMDGTEICKLLGETGGASVLYHSFSAK